MAMGIDMQQPSPDSLIVEKINFLQTDLFLIKSKEVTINQKTAAQLMNLRGIS
jgi:hypothetical protein